MYCVEVSEDQMLHLYMWERAHLVHILEANKWLCSVDFGFNSLEL